jgi:hypothetical protein
MGDVGSFDTIIVHLSNPDTVRVDEEKIFKADLVITQYISPDYPAAHLATQKLKQSVNSKLVVVPNLYFRGYNPDVCYLNLVRSDNAGNLLSKTRLQTLWGDYCSATGYKSWLEGKSVAETVARYRWDCPETNSAYRNTAENSIYELRRREEPCDVGISDFIEENWMARRLFFTFNHPAEELLIELVRRTLGEAQIATRNKIPEHFFPQTLDNIFPNDIPGYILDRCIGVSEYTTGFIREKKMGVITGEFFSIEDVITQLFVSLDFHRDDGAVSFKVSQ